MRLFIAIALSVAASWAQSPIRAPFGPTLWQDGVFCSPADGTVPPPYGSSAPCPNWTRADDSFARPARSVNGSGDAVLTTNTTLFRAAASPGLQLLVVTRSYSDFPGAFDVSARVQLAGVNASLVCDLAEADWLIPLPPGAAPTLYHQFGSNNSAADFGPKPPVSLAVGAAFQTTPQGGRSSNFEFPAFVLALPGGGGLAWMVGWSGNWEQNVTRDGAAVRVRIASATSSATGARFCAAMQPGEAFRLARVAALPWAGPDPRAGYNALRRFLRRHVAPLGPDRQPAGLLLSANTFDRFSPRNESSNLFVLPLMKNVSLDTYWHDASWMVKQFPDGAGEWRLPLIETEDRADFPDGIRYLMDLARAPPAPLQTILWTEPERVTQFPVEPGGAPSYIFENFPGYTLGPAHGTLFNLGNRDAWRYMTDFLTMVVNSYLLTVLRFDFNMDPALAWQEGDARAGGARAGVTERLYVEGLYAMWDAIKGGAYTPDLLLDSCASGGRRIDLEVLSRAVVFDRSDYELGSSAGVCAIAGPGDFDDGGADYEASQSMTMGAFLVSAIPFGDGVRSYVPYATRSAGPGAKGIDWGLGNWRALSTNGTALALIRQSLDEARLLRGLVLAPNDYYALGPAARDADVWTGYQVHTDSGAGFAIYFRRCNAPQANFSAPWLGLSPTVRYVLSLRYDYAEAARVTMTGAQLAGPGLVVALPPMGSLLVVYAPAQ